MATTLTARTDVRWMIRRDFPGALAVERDTAGTRGVEPWEEREFAEAQRNARKVGMVSTRGDSVTGFMAYNLWRDRLEVLRFAAGDRDAARALAEKLAHKVGSHRRAVAVMAGADGVERAVRLGWEVRADWLTNDVRALCAGDGVPYTPILADALEDAGCGDGELLRGLRDTVAGPLVFGFLAEVI